MINQYVSTFQSECNGDHHRNWLSRRSGSWEATHRIQSMAHQHPLRRGLYTAPISMKIPHNVPPVQLREHLGYLIDLRRGEAEAVAAGGRRGKRRRPAIAGRPGRGEKVAIDKVAEHGHEGEAGDGDGGLFVHRGRHGCADLVSRLRFLGVASLGSELRLGSGAEDTGGRGGRVKTLGRQCRGLGASLSVYTVIGD